MATGRTFEQRVRILFETLGTKQVQKELSAMTTKTGALNKNFKKKMPDLAKRLGVTPQTLEQMRQLNTQTEAQKKAFQESRKEVKRFKGEYLGLMFAGMSLQKAFGGMTKNLISNFQEMVGEATNPLNDSLTRLEANFKFLKFSIVEAAGPLIMRVTDMLSEMARSMAKADPSVLKGIFTSIAALAGVGGIMNVFGQGAIFFSSIYSGMAHKQTISALQAAGGMKANTLSKGTKFFNSMAKVAGAGAIALGISNVFSGMDKTQQENFKGAVFDFAQGVAEISGGALIFKGKTGKGGALLAAAFGLELAEKGVLGEGIAKAVGTIAGLGGILGRASRKVVAEVRETLRVAIGDNWYLNAMFFGVRGASKKSMETDAMLAGETWAQTISRGFKQSFDPIVEAGKGFDDLTTGEGPGKTTEFGLADKDIQAAVNQLPASFRGIKEQSKEAQLTTNKMLVDLMNMDNTVAVDLPENTKAWMNSKEKGLAGVETKVDNINKKLSEPINKTVNITEKVTRRVTTIGGGSNTSSVNTGA